MTALPTTRTLQVAACMVPAILITLFAGLIALIALALDTSRRQYALDLADRFADLASVMVGASRPRRTPIARSIEDHDRKIPK